MTTARTIAELWYDGPMPPEVIDRLKHGSALKAEIVRCEDSVAFYKDEISRLNRSVRRWEEKGNLGMMNANIQTVREYTGELSRLRAWLKDLRATDASLKGAKQFFDTLSPKEPDDAI